MKDEQHHPDKISYVVERKYEPDFLIEHKEGVYVVEFKGFFRDSPEASKYVWINKALPSDHELIFVFDKPTKPIHFRAKRNDGSKQTHGEWATKNGFRYFDEESFAQFYKSIEK